MNLSINVPDSLAQELIEFIEFLQSKYKTKALSYDINLSSQDDDNNSNGLMLAQSLSVQDWDNEEDDFWNNVLK
jgi:hypothetical protein